MVDDVADLLGRVQFDPERSVLTRRQAEVLALREQGRKQQEIADRLGTSRANVSGIEASARTNVERARETVAFAEALEAPVSVRIPTDGDLYDVPSRVYDACDEAGVRVNHTAPELMGVVGERGGQAVRGRRIRNALVVSVTREGEVRVRRDDHGE